MFGNVLEVIKATIVLRVARAHVQGVSRAYGLLPQIKNKGTLRIGPGFQIRGQRFRVGIAVGTEGTLNIGRDVFLNQGVSIAAMTTIMIGDNVKIADLVTIQDTNYHQVSPDEPIVAAPITICRNVWLGRLSIISPGVTIGENSVVAAGSIVTKNVEPNTVVAGAPAKLVRVFSVPEGWVRG